MKRGTETHTDIGLHTNKQASKRTEQEGNHVTVLHLYIASYINAHIMINTPRRGFNSRFFIM